MWRADTDAFPFMGNFIYGSLDLVEQQSQLIDGGR